jgi:uncharacterized protein YdaU (DUF1376 family)
MNFYQHHIGDYAEATSHLSILEDGIYSRMIRKYYALECCLPTSEVEIFRLLSAKKRAERDATRRVLKEFFELREDGWHNERCDEELAKYFAEEPERNARKANEEARIKRFREDRARLYEDLKLAGHTPPWNAPIAVVRDLHERFCKKPVTPPVTLQAVTAPVTRNAYVTATHTQLPSPNTQLPTPTHSSASPQSGRKRGVGNYLKNGEDHGNGLARIPDRHAKTTDELEREEAARAVD